MLHADVLRLRPDRAEFHASRGRTLLAAGRPVVGESWVTASAKAGVFVDARETAPAATTRTTYLDAQGNADPKKSRDLGTAVGVPGTVAGFALALEKYGSGKLSWAEVCEPSRRLAAEGHVISQNTAAMLQQTRFGRWFDVTGSRTTHYGLFPCGPTFAAAERAGAAATPTAGACC